MPKFVVGLKDANLRVDSFIVRNMHELTRSHAQKLCIEQKIKVNSKLTKPSQVVRSKDVVSVDVTSSLSKSNDLPNIPVVYEDDNCLVINKPAGILAHSKGAFNPEVTVETFIKPKLSKKYIGERAGIVHRLDRGTSGVMICAKTPSAMSWLQKQFSTRKVKKTYLAVIEGLLDPREAIIDMPIERNPKKPQTFRVGNNGKSAQTKYETINQIDDGCSLIKLTPTTGRTHQLRVHMAHMGHPIVGDKLYGGSPNDRLYLHSHTLEITLPDSQRTLFKPPIPKEFSRFGAIDNG